MYAPNPKPKVRCMHRSILFLVATLRNPNATPTRSQAMCALLFQLLHTKLEIAIDSIHCTDSQLEIALNRFVPSFQCSVVN